MFAHEATSRHRLIKQRRTITNFTDKPLKAQKA
jgi:hypothetical protein